MDQFLNSDFEAAIQFVRTAKFQASQEDQLKFYAYFKQSTEGQCNTPQPGFFDFTAKAKWSAWKELGDISQQYAKSAYVEHLTKLCPEWREGGVTTTAKKGPAWVCQSRPVQDEDEMLDKDKSISDWVQEGNLEKVKEILDESPDQIHFEGEGNLQPLHYACDAGNLELCELLLNYSPNVNKQDNEGQTPLHYACICEHTDIISLLIKHGADVNIKDNEGQTPADLNNSL
eukprot:TRINITY_DN3478_c4_g1_i2.p1 TRINITY_DN3478_c4_g1~~TRINITY_DN3478_c4_g1_i2.p1  ORF type:complete len:230 (-),score=35.23 TRINITY_DN3478_c4_g1_i2:180-869(-)